MAMRDSGKKVTGTFCAKVVEHPGLEGQPAAAASRCPKDRLTLDEHDFRPGHADDRPQPLPGGILGDRLAVRALAGSASPPATPAGIVLAAVRLLTFIERFLCLWFASQVYGRNENEYRSPDSIRTRSRTGTPASRPRSAPCFQATVCSMASPRMGGQSSRLRPSIGWPLVS